MQKPEVAETSIFRAMQIMMAYTHEQRGISVLSGPPGIGKTTAIDAFGRENDGQCLIVKAMPSSRGMGASPAVVLQSLIDTYCEQHGTCNFYSLRTSIPHLNREFRNLLADYYHPEDYAYSRLTLVFDEAQYLSPAAIEMLRYWNDADRTTMLFPIGLIFVGNNEFALAASSGRASVLTEAVRDRLLHNEQLAYANLSNDDLHKVAASRGVTDRSAVDLIIRYFAATRLNRSLRQLDRILERCSRMAGDAPITAQLVNDILNPQ